MDKHWPSWNKLHEDYEGDGEWEDESGDDDEDDDDVVDVAVILGYFSIISSSMMAIAW